MKQTSFKKKNTHNFHIYFWQLFKQLNTSPPHVEDDVTTLKFTLYFPTDWKCQKLLESLTINKK